MDPLRLLYLMVKIQLIRSSPFQHTILTVQAFQMVITLKITAAPVMLMAVMTVFRIVLALGVEDLKMMTVVFEVVIIQAALTVQAYQMVIT